MIEVANLKIAIIGGCHVEGFLIGKEKSFVSVFSQILFLKGASHIINIAPYVNIKRSNRIREICTCFQPDWFIIQENYIFSGPSASPSKIKGTMKGILNKKHSLPLISNSRGDTEFKPDFYFFTKEFIKRILYRLINYKGINKREVLDHIHLSFSALTKAGLKKVIVLSPLPTSSDFVNLHREIGGLLLKTKSEEFNFTYLDVYHEIKDAFKGRVCTVDEIHLKAEAHRIIGESIARCILTTEGKNSYHISANGVVA
jgi:hypothetical protein